MIVRHGSRDKINFLIQGKNARLDELQAGFLRYNLKKLDTEILIKNKIAKIYNSNLNNNVQVPIMPNNSISSYSLYTILCLKEKRNKIITKLKKNFVNCGIYYLKLLNKNKLFFNKKKFKNAQYVSERALSIPINPFLKQKEIKKIIHSINNFQ